MAISIIREIVQRSGASRRTVLRVLAEGGPACRPSLMARAQQIRALADELGYRPNAAARAMNTGRFHAIGMLLGDDVRVSSHVPPTFLEEVLSLLAVSGLNMVMSSLSDVVLSDQQRAPNLLRELAVDGLLVMYDVGAPEGLVDLLTRKAGPLIWVNRRVEQDGVRPDDIGAGRLATELALRRGHRRIAYLDPLHEDDRRTNRLHYSKEDRLSGYRTQMEAAGLAPQVILDPLWSEWNRLDSARAMLADPGRPSAFICQNAVEAGILMLGASQLGLSVPRDVSLMILTGGSGECFSGLKQPDREMGRAAVAQLTRRMAKTTIHLPTMLVPYTEQLGATLAEPPR